MNKTLLIKLTHLQTIEQESENYLSFSVDEGHHYFSCSFRARTGVLDGDIVMKLDVVPQYILLHRWLNHTIIFSHVIDLSQLKLRSVASMAQQTKPNQILSFMMILIEKDEIIYNHTYIPSVSQHYLLFSNVSIMKKKEERSKGPSYFLLKTDQSKYVLPINNGTLCVQLPTKLQFFYFKDGKEEASAPQFNSMQLVNKKMKLVLEAKYIQYPIAMDLTWAVNLYQSKSSKIPMEAHELYMYEFQLKLQNVTQLSNCSVKITYNHKVYEVCSELNNPKGIKVKKIAHFMILSSNQEITIVIERSFKVIGVSKLYTDEIEMNKINQPKRKFVNPQNNNLMGTIKFKCEKGKYLSTPHNNKQWKQIYKKQSKYLILSLEQFSISYEYDESLSLALKTQSQEKTIPSVPNIQYFHNDKQITYSPLNLSIKPDQNLFMMIKSKQSKQQFIGVAVITLNELMLGVNVLQIPFFKNHTKTVTLNCIINKIPPYPFIKAANQPGLSTHLNKTMHLTVSIHNVHFTPYYYTYQYDNKFESYCIVDANRVKKALKLKQKQLQFIPQNDRIDFIVQYSQFIKINISFIVTDIGQNEEVYGSVSLKMKLGQLFAKEKIYFQKLELKNDFNLEIGQFQCQVGFIEEEPKAIVQEKSIKKESVKKSVPKRQKITLKKQLKKINQDISKVNLSMEKIELSMSRKHHRKEVNPIRKLIASNQLNKSLEIRDGKSFKLPELRKRKLDP